MDVEDQRYEVTDEWPPASALEGGTGASLRATTKTDSNSQGGQFDEMWDARDNNNKVKFIPDYLNDPGLSDHSKALLSYCTCGSKTGQDWENCCRNDGFQFQRQPSGNNAQIGKQFELTDINKPVPAGSPGR